jgi:hypothetical protein
VSGIGRPEKETRRVSDVAGIAIPLITAFGGLVVGAGFGRVTSRNDVRRQQYADGLSALDKLIAAPDDAEISAGAHSRLVEVGNWIALDSVPVSNAFNSLVRVAVNSSAPALDRDVRAARLEFIQAARLFTTWRLVQRFLLQARTKRDDGDALWFPKPPPG